MSYIICLRTSGILHCSQKTLLFKSHIWKRLLMKLCKLYFGVKSLGSTWVQLQYKAWRVVESQKMFRRQRKVRGPFLPYSLDRSGLPEKLWQTQTLISKLAKSLHHLDNRWACWEKKHGNVLRKTRFKRTKERSDKRSKWMTVKSKEPKETREPCIERDSVNIWKHGILSWCCGFQKMYAFWYVTF